MRRRTRLVRFLIRLVFLPGLILWELFLRLGMLVAKLRSGVSIQGRVLVLALRGYRYWSSLQPRSLASTRKSQDALGARIRTAPEVAFQDAQVPDRPALWAVPRGALEGKVILYFHGGGYTTGSILTHRSLVSNIAKASRMRVLSVGYRLAPENPHPAAFEDAVAAWRWLRSRGYEGSDIALGGDSAGGGLAMSLLVFLRDEAGRTAVPDFGAAVQDSGATLPDSMPSGIALLSPWLDLSDSRESWEKLAGTDWLLTPESLQDDARKYLGAPAPSCSDLRDPYVSPRYAELGSLPPMLVHVGGDELLRDDIHAFVLKARASGTRVCLDEWPGMFHDWHLMASYLPEGRRAVDEIGVFFRIMLA
jgi:acetyl esterase/lipase